MTAYRSSKPYRSSERYRPSKGGVYTTPALSRSFAVSANAAVSASSHSVASWARVAHLSEHTQLAWNVAQSKDAPLVAPWGKAMARAADTALAWQEAEKQNRLFVVGWGKAMALTSKGADFAWELANPLDTDSIACWGAPEPLATVYSTKWLMISHRHIADDYRTNKPYRSFWRYVERRQRITHNTYSRAPWSATSAHKSDLEMPWGGGFSVWGTDRPINWDSDTSPIPDKDPAIEPEIKEVYAMATDLTVKELATGTVLDVDSVNISLDLDSFAWRCSMRALNQASMSRMMPPAEIEVKTMGWRWVFVVEKYTKTRGAGSTWQVEASSRTKQLHSPWAEASSHTQSAPTTFKQAAESLLPLGWAATWHGIEDFSLAANAWSYNNKTPKDALADMLDAVGAVMVPDREDYVFHIQPRYKYAPWEYDAETTEADMIVHESMILRESGEYRPGIKNNGVWVSGNTRHGVIVEVIRSGTDGKPFASDTYHDLTTSDTAARQKGKQIIAASGAKTLTTIETFITDEELSPGLITPGDLVEVRSDGETWRGICLSVSMSELGAPRLTQIITVERSHDDDNQSI